MPRNSRRFPLFTNPFTLDELLCAGHTVAELRGWVARGEVQRVARGVYATASTIDLPGVRGSAERRSILVGDTPTSVLTAAQFHGMWLPPEPHPSLRSTDSRRKIPAEHLIRRGAVTMPDVMWTALQVARWQPLHAALISLDFALAQGISADDLRDVAAALHRWPGALGLCAAVEQADGRSESALESWSRGRMITARLPRPELQVPITVDGYRMRLDFVFPNARLIGEADGESKYGDGEHARRSLYDEKRRQARLQSAGYLLYRWGWREVRYDCAAWEAGLRTALARRSA